MLTPALSPWATLRPAALAGTRRQVFAPLPGLTPPLGPEADLPEKQLLLTAANLALVQRAGQRPPTGPATLPPRPPETRPAVPEAAFHRLEAVLADFPAERWQAQYYPQQYILRALLADLHRQGRRLPLRVAWRLLGFPFAHDEYEAALTAQALGERSRWLHELLDAGQPTWLGHVLGTLRQAEGYPYNALRYRLRRPMAADESYLAEFARQPASQQTQLLWWTWQDDGGQQLPPPLQQALDELLAATPPAQRPWPADVRRLQQYAPGHPRLADHPGLARLAEAAATMLTLERPASQPARVRIELPAAWQEEWQKLGVWRTPSYFRRRNERETWLQEILYILGPRYWAGRWQLPPAEVVALTAAAPRGELVLHAWVFALVHNSPGKQLDPDFAWALLASSSAAISVHLRAGLAGHLPPAEQAAWLATLLPADVAAPHEPEWDWVLNGASHLLRQPHLLRQLLPTLAAALARPRQSGTGLDKLLETLAKQPLDAALYPEVQAALGAVHPPHPGLARALNLLLQGLALRYDVWQASLAAAVPAAT